MRSPAEAALLAAVINGANPADAAGITAAAFYDPRDGAAWQAMAELAAQGIRPDYASVASHIGKTADPDHLKALRDPTINPASITHHAREVATQASRRALVDVAYRIHAAADSDTPYEQIVEQARKLLDDAVIARQDSQTLADIYPGMVADMRAGKTQGATTPWPELDRHILGLQPGRLYTIAARPGVGKSIMAQNIAERFARRGGRVYFSTLEMEAGELGIRFLSHAVGIDSAQLQAGHLTAAQWQAVENAGQGGFVQLPIDICATSTQTVDTIRAGARDSSRRGELSLIVVDYLQLMEGGSKTQSRAEVVAGFTRGLKNLAGEFKVPVVAMSQLNRAAADGKPTMAHLRESGAIEQDSDVVILLHEDIENDPGIVQVIVEKARNGTRGSFELHKFGHHSALVSPGQPSPAQFYTEEED